ncbi:hypothetical protein FRC17_004645 [Serendipita sp. 399]|nr:hypothetical protein FRC17_004645 [Serendipita sp. 399]
MSSFRAEPFRNLTPKSLAPQDSPFNVFRASDMSHRAVPLVVDNIGVSHGQNQDELVDDDGDIENHNLSSTTFRGRYRGEPADLRSRTTPGGVNTGPSNFIPVSIAPEMPNPTYNSNGDTPLNSDRQRSSISSTSSGSQPRRSSSGDGFSEWQGPASGKGKRKSISAVQSGMMNSFKIRPPTVWEATGGPQAPLSVAAPKSTYFPPPSSGSNHLVTSSYMSGGTVAPDDRFRDAPPPHQEITFNAEIQPYADKVVKPARKKPRREPPTDSGIQISYHDDVVPTPASTITTASSSDLVQPPVQSPLTSPLSQPITSPPLPNTDVITTLPTEIPTPPITLVAPSISTPSITTPDPPPTDPPAPSSSLTHLPTTQGKIDNRLTIYDSSDRTFTIPSPDPLDKNGPPPKRWTPASRDIVTLGGGSWKISTWVSQEIASVPAKPPPGFKPVPRVKPYGADPQTAVSSANIAGVLGGGGSTSAVGAAGQSSATSVNLGLKGLAGKATLDVSRSLAPPKKVKKSKSEGNMKAAASLAGTSTGGGGGPLEASVIASGASSPVLGSVPLTPVRGTGRKRLVSSRKNKKSSAAAGDASTEGAGTPALVEPASLALGNADTDTEMKDA